MRLKYFITLDHHFQQLLTFAQRHSLSLILRSFGDASSTGYHIVANDLAELLHVFQERNCREIVISKGELPKSQHDWQFLNRAQDSLIIIEGGRQEVQALEKSEMRLFAKGSHLRPQFPKLRKRIQSVCTCQGMQTKEGVLYNEIIYEPLTLSYELRENISNSDPKHVYIPA
jgi:hypothetical protein